MSTSYLQDWRSSSRLKMPDKQKQSMMCKPAYQCFGEKEVSPTFLKIFLFIVHKEGGTVGDTNNSFLLNSLTSFTSSSVYIDMILPPDLCKGCVTFSNLIIIKSMICNHRQDRWFVMRRWNMIVQPANGGRFSSLRTFREEERLRLSDRNSILMT